MWREPIPYIKSKNWLPQRAIKWLAKRLDIDHVLLQKIIKESKTTPNSLYQTITVKRNGKPRKIRIPSKDLMAIQRKINGMILTKFPRHENAFGFSGGSIVDAISLHLKGPGARSIWMCDIKDAFPSMFRERVLGVFRSQFSESASQMLTLLTTLPSGQLPQGAPTSPRIFDLCMRLFDREFSKIAEDKKGKYSRYADNIFFSGKKERLIEIEKEVLGWFQMAELDTHKIKIKELRNETAVRMLGLNIIGRKIHNTRGFKRALRLSIHHANWLLDNGKRGTLDFVLTWQKLKGQMNFARTDTLPPKLLNNYLELNKRLS